jgi:hypothetical protein
MGRPPHGAHLGLAVTVIRAVVIGLRNWFGGGWPEACGLMAMHVAVWAICVTLLPAAVVANKV